MSYSVQTVKADLSAVLHGTTTNQITGLNNLLNRSARQLILDIDPQETIREVEFVNPIFNSVFDYPIAADVKGTGLIDILPQVNRIPRDIWLQGYNQAFDIAKENIFSQANMFTVNFNSGLKSIRISAPFLNPPIILNQAESITDNGTWTVGGTASNLTVSNTNFVQGVGSLEFNITAGAGWVEISNMTAIDLTAHLNQASEFLNAFVPDGSKLTSINFRWGSSSSNYYSSTVTATQQATAFQNGWNLAQFIWANATVVGSPNSVSINYLRVTLNVSGGMTACKVNGITSNLGSILSYQYYSKYLFRNYTTGAFQETVTDDSNLINLDTESYNLYFNLSAHFAVQQQQGIDAMFFDSTFFGQQYQAGIARYKALYKSQRQKPQSIYYKKPNVSNNRFFGRRYN